MRHFIIALLILSSCSAWAEKAGLYIGAGISASNYSSPDNDEFKDAFEDERTNGWRAELGYIWDLGKPGGFHMGVAGTYDDFGKAKGDTQYFDAFGPRTLSGEVEARALSVLLVIEQEIVKWVDFVFKIGPAFVDYDRDATDTWYSGGTEIKEPLSESSSEVGASMALGFTFFPTDYLAIEVARQGMAFVTSDSDEDDAITAGTWSASLQYRF
jgi:hypothetical protein